MTEKLTNGTMENWASATNLDDWTETMDSAASVNREATEVYDDTYSCRFDFINRYAQCSIDENFTLTAGEPYLLSLWYINSNGYDYSVDLIVEDSGSNVTLESDGTWGSSSISLPEVSTWTQYKLPFSAHASYTAYNIKLEYNISGD